MKLIHALFQAVEAPTQVVEALIDVNQVLLSRLFGVGKALLQVLLDTKKALVHAQDVSSKSSLRTNASAISSSPSLDGTSGCAGG